MLMSRDEFNSVVRDGDSADIRSTIVNGICEKKQLTAVLNHYRRDLYQEILDRYTEAIDNFDLDTDKLVVKNGVEPYIAMEYFYRCRTMVSHALNSLTLRHGMEVVELIESV